VANRDSFGSLGVIALAQAVICGLVLSPLLVSGCGTSRPVVEGTITLDGIPVRKGAIQLKPVDGKGQTAGTGVVDGRYRMEASPGTMKVIINWPQANGKMMDPSGSGQMIDRYVESVPPQYNEKTELTITVKPGVNVADFAIEGSTLSAADKK
jgi:hypothetical protein